MLARQTTTCTMIVIAAACGSTLAAAKTWNAAGTDFNNGTNWTDGLPGAGDIATFSSSFSNQPSLTGAIGVGAVHATTGLGQDVTIGGTELLTLNGTTVASQANTAILLDVNRNLSFTAPLSIANGKIITNNSTGTISLPTSLTTGSTLSVTGSNSVGVVAFNSAINTQLSINTAGTVRMSGNNANTTRLISGTLDLAASLTLNGNNNAATSEAGTIITTSTTGTTTLTHNANNLFTLNGTIQDGGVGKVLAIYNSNGIITLAGSNDYSGGTTITNSSRLALGSDTALGSGGLVLDPNARVRSTSDTARSLANNVSTGGTVYFGSTAPGETGNLSFGTLTRGANNTKTFVDNGRTSFTAINGGGIMEKEGAGTLSIGSGQTSTFTGTFLVTTGVLELNTNLSSVNGGSTVGVNGTLGGTGTAGGNWTVDGSLRPGASAGTLAIENNLTLNATATYRFEGGDLTTVGGTLDLNDDWTLALGSGLQNGGSVVLFTYGSLAASPDLTPSIDTSGLGFTPGTLTLSQVGTSVVLNGVSVVPEPATLSLLAASALGLLRRRR